MKLLLLVLLIIIRTSLTAQEFNPNKKYHADSLKHWTKSVMTEFSKKHPGFYRYTTKERFDFVIDSTLRTFTDSLSELNFYRSLKPLIAQIGCLHTGVSLSKEYSSYLDKTSSLIPIEIFIDNEKRVFIRTNYSSNQALPLKSQIVSINDRPIGEILKILFKAIPSDGYNETEKTLLLNHRFAFWYQTMVENVESFAISTVNNGESKTYDLKGVSENIFPTMKSLETNYKKPLEFDLEGDIGVLKIHTFAKSDIKRGKQSFRKFAKATFKTLKANQVKRLVVDLRYNTGGTDGNAALLASYFFDKPFRYWDKIEVTEALAKEVKGVAKFFYKKPVKRDSSYLWRKTWLTREFDYYETQKPSKYSFNGETYILTNGLCMSSCADFTAILAYNNKAKVVGQETGGGYQGNNSGMMPTLKIPTGLSITVPLQKYTNAVDLNKNFGHGTLPDYQVIPTIDYWIEKRDVEMDFALRLVKKD